MAVAIDGYVILTGHPSRAGQKSDGSGDSGSVQWSATGRSRLYLKRPEQEKGGEPVDPYLRRLERRKATYASIGDFIDLRWDNGVFVPVNPPASGIIGAIQRQNAERILIDFVAKTTSENQWLSVNKNAGNFAPRVLMDRPTTERGGFGREDFTRAMQSALSSQKLVNEEYGRTGDRRYRLAVNAKEVSA